MILYELRRLMLSRWGNFRLELEEPCVALPDIYLGAWQHYGQNANPQAPRAELLFSSLRRQLGTIYRRSTRRLFTARRPFTSFE